MNGEPLTILLVEDNPDHAELVMRSMEDFQVANSIIHVEDGEAALDYLHGRGNYSDRKLFPMPHLMLLDLRLPKVDGLEVLKEVKGTSSTEGHTRMIGIKCNIPIVYNSTSIDCAVAFKAAQRSVNRIG